MISSDDNKYDCRSDHRNETAEVFRCDNFDDKIVKGLLIDILSNPMIIKEASFLVRSGKFGSFVR